MKTIDKWEDVFGSDAEYDIAQDLENVYENSHHKSSVLWTELTDNQHSAIPTDSLENRPEVYATHGYTSEFEGWGIEMSQMAIDCGFHDVDSIVNFIKANVFQLKQ